MPFSKLRILVPLEEPAAEEALVRLAATLAAARQGELHLVHLARTVDARVSRELEQAAKMAAELGAPAFPHLVEGEDLVPGIQQAVVRWQCNMMVMGWYRDVERGAILATQNRVLAKAIAVDTLIFKERHLEPSRRILVPTGGGHHSLMGVQVAHDLAQAWGAELEILRIARDPRCRPDDPILQRYCTQLHSDMELQLQLLRIEAPITILPAVDVVSTIVGRAGQSDLVVVGASNDWRQDEYLAGSVPDEIANRVAAPVLMVRSATSEATHLSGIFWEQTIRLDFRPADKWDAITQLVDLLVEEKQVPQTERQHVLDAALAREHKGSTALGRQTAVPHAPIPSLPGIIGALGICRDGIDFDSPDGEPVHFVFLLLTPQENYRNYIPVLAQLASLMRPVEARAGFLGCQTPTEVTTLIKTHEKSREH
jgi:mannitol/fructose-specific phosphotransferase system IIA component (Ntr-type)/nucleotide-binding universal stress UspA family protein